MYPNSRVWHLELDTGAAGERLTYTRRLLPGAADEQHYGLLLAEAIGIPTEVSTPVMNVPCNAAMTAVRATIGSPANRFAPTEAIASGSLFLRRTRRAPHARTTRVVWVQMGVWVCQDERW